MGGKLIRLNCMRKSTILLFGLCVGLLVAITAVITRVATYHPAADIPQPGGAYIPLGLPIETNRPQKDFDAGSVMLLDTTNNHIMFEQNAFERRPIASISKLMTAMVALDYGMPWEKEVDIQLEEYVQGGQLLLHPGEKVTMRDLFHASLAGSANNATLAYVRQLGIPKEEFVREMNRKAVELGLEQTEFRDVTGLSPENLSTAYEVAVMAKTAFAKYPAIRAATVAKEYAFTVRGSNREHVIHNTNKLIADLNEQAGGSKTGYLYEAGYCLVMQGEGEIGTRLGVILGSPSEQGNFADMRRLLHLNVP